MYYASKYPFSSVLQCTKRVSGPKPIFYDVIADPIVIQQLPQRRDEPLDVEFFKYNRAAAKSPTFCNMREICGRHKLQPGHYCVIPSTFQPNQDGDFLLRMFSEKPTDTW